MWTKFRGRSFEPRRPPVFPGQWPLVVLTVLAVAGGIAVVVAVLLA